MAKVVIIGNIAAGKTVYAYQLSKRLGVGSTNLDVYGEQLGWSNYEAFVPIAESIMISEKWILDGSIFHDHLPVRVSYADTIIFLDYSPFFLTYRLVKRNFIAYWSGYLSLRESVRITRDLRRQILDNHRRHRPVWIQTIKDNAASKKCLHWRNPRRPHFDWVK